MSTALAHATRRLERWIWTGPIGHLLGGLMDFGGSLAHYWLSRARGDLRTRLR